MHFLIKELDEVFKFVPHEGLKPNKFQKYGGVLMLDK